MTVTPTVEISCKVSLTEHIILATQEDVSYPPLGWRLTNGDIASVEVEVAADKIRHDYATYSVKGKDNYFVNSRVEHLRVMLSMVNVSADDFERLNGKHPTADVHRAHLVSSTTGEGVDIDYQDAEVFGKRVYQEIREAVNHVLEIIRDVYGQHWLKLLVDEQSTQNFLDEVRATYRFSPSEEWKRLLVSPNVASFGPVGVGGAKRFLEISDWIAMQTAVDSGTRPNLVLTLLSEANERFDRGDKQLAIIHLSSALEWAVTTYLEAQLASRIPKKPLDQILDQSHGRLLEDWVWPLNGEVGTGITQQEWQAVKGVQKLRQKAGHEFLAPEIESLADDDFLVLLVNSSAFIQRLTGVQQLKRPFPMLSTSRVTTG
jgi:hypothetical protein